MKIYQQAKIKNTFLKGNQFGHSALNNQKSKNDQFDDKFFLQNHCRR